MSGITDWHINADEPVVLDYNTNFKSAGQQVSLYSPDAFRAADHDPVVIGLDLNTLYGFTGFFPPVANPPELNVIHAGRVVAVQFSLGGNQGLSIFDVGYPKSVEIDCDVSGGATWIGTPEATGGPGRSSLMYDASTDTYLYEWKTERAWANTCRELIVRLADESVHRAWFQFGR